MGITFKKVFCIAIIVFFFISLSYFSYDVIAYTEDDFGCCIDEVLGCRNVFGSEEIISCEDNPDSNFEQSVSCYPIETRPDIEVIDHPLCQPQGCCCLGDTFIDMITRDECDTLDGTYVSGSDCKNACGIQEPDQKRCIDVNGYWCLASEKDPEAFALTSQIDDFSDRPSDEHICYNQPCLDIPDQDCEKGDFPREFLCTDGKNNDQDCSIDQADSDCQYSVSGTVVDMNDFPVSNVKLRLVNYDHVTRPDDYDNHIDTFIVYSVGKDGAFFFKGLSEGSYKIEVIDSYYQSAIGELSFIVSSSKSYASDLKLKVVPRNTFSIEGTVTDGEDVLENAIISIKETSHYAQTDDSGDYDLSYIPVLSSDSYYTLYVFKEGFFPLSTVIKSGKVGDVLEKDFSLQSTSCSINPKPPVFNNVSLIKGTTTIRLNFNTGNCKAEQIHIYRCEDVCEDESTFQHIATLPGYANEFEDLDYKKWGLDYSYYITSESNDVFTSPSEIRTINTGDVRCKNKQDVNSFCIYETENIFDEFNSEKIISSKGVVCNDANQIEIYEGRRGPVECDDNSRCVEIDPGTLKSTTYCKDFEKCEPSPDNYFGLYFDKENCQGENNNNFCVYDTSVTNVDDCFSCSMYPDCNSYRSESSCTEDLCKVGNCEWRITNEALNQGICFDEKEKECVDCHNIFNSFFGLCDQDTCNLFGNCSLSSLDNQCKDCETISCYDYATEETCTGQSYELRINKATNELTRSSSDQCLIGSCRWDSLQNYCYKDRDVDYENDCDDVEQKNIYFASNDAFSDYTYDVCVKDILAPETSVDFDKRYFNPFDPVYGSIKINFNAKDSSKNSMNLYEVKDVYYCLSPANENICSDISSFEPIRQKDSDNNKYIILKDPDDDMALKPTGGKKYTLKSGLNYIYYYSKDYAHNLEIVKKEKFYVDFDPPHIEISSIKKSDPSKRKNDIILNIESNELVYCYISLDSCEDIGNCDEGYFDESMIDEDFINAHIDDFSLLVSKEFNDLIDGYNQMEVLCTDLAGNVVQEKDTLLLDSDPRIQSPSPSGPVDESQITLSVKTISPVECRYTSDVNKNFEDIPLNHKMSRKISGSLYEHYTQLNLQKAGLYTYYVRCNYDPVAVEKVSFTLDRIPPISTIAHNPFLESTTNGWVRDGQIIFNCSDEPEFGFGCNTTTYCIRDVPNVHERDILAECNPDMIYESPILLDKPSTICYFSKENIFNGMGGLQSEKICRNIFVDSSNPYLIIDPLPSSSNKNEMEIRGRVYDSYTNHKISFSKDNSYNSFFDLFNRKDYYTSFYDDFDYIDEFDYVTSIDLDDLGKTLSFDDLHIDGTIRFIFQHSSENSYGALVFYPQQNKISLGVQRNLLGFQEIESIQVDDSFFSGTKTIRITKSEEGIEASVIDTTIYEDSFRLFSDASLLKRLFRGEFGIIIEDNSDNNLFYKSLKNSFDELSIYHPGDSYLSEIPKTIYFEQDGTMKTVLDTKNEFVIKTSLTEDTPRHGTAYTMNLFAEDISGRRSNTIGATIFYDLSGPEAKDLIFLPTIDQESQEYIEYQSDAFINVQVDDDYSEVRSVELLYGTQSLQLKKQIGSSLWAGVLSTISLPIGNHTVKLKMTDGIGNVFIQEFKKSLVVEDRIDPLLTFDIDRGFFNTSQPFLSFTTDEIARCEISYESFDGEDITQQISSSYDKEHQINLEHDLYYEINNTVENELLLSCTDQNMNRVTYLLYLTIDLRKPHYSIKPNKDDLIINALSKNRAEYTSLKPTNKIFYMLSDEPVKCKYSRSAEKLTHSYYDMTKDFFKSYDYFESDKTNSFYFTKGYSETFNFQCQDIAGNIGDLKTIHLSVDDLSEPYLFDLPNSILINKQTQGSDKISFNLIRDGISCKYKLSDTSYKTLTSSSTASLFKVYEIPISSLQEGSEQVTIECYSDYYGKTERRVQVLKDYSDPTLNISSDEGLMLYNKENSSHMQMTEVNSSFISFSLLSSELIDLQIMNNGLISSMYSDFKEKTITIPLEYGFNDILFSAKDKAGNEVEYAMRVISLKPKLSYAFSQPLSDTVADSYKGNLIIKGSKDLTPSEIDVRLSFFNSKGILSNTIYTLPRSLLSDNKSSYYPILLKRDVLKNMYFGTNSNPIIEKEDFLEGDLVDIFTIPLTLEILSENTTVHREVFLYNPFVESLFLDSPQSPIIKEEDLLNNNYLNFSGEFLQENYIYDETYTYHRDINSSYTATSLNVSSGHFNNVLDVIKGKSVFSIQAMNDLGFIFGISTKLFYDETGPVPDISIYPNGDITFSKNPLFTLYFNEPAYIEDIFVTNLTHNFSVEHIDHKEMIFFKKIKLIDSLSDEGEYYLNVLAKDEEGIIKKTQFPFTYSERPLQLNLVAPYGGVSSQESFEVVLISDRVLECRYSLEGVSSFIDMYKMSGYSSRHKASVHLDVDESREMMVRCKEYSGDITDLFTYTLHIDKTPPKINSIVFENAEYISAMPYIIQYPLTLKVNISSNEPVRCGYNVAERGVSLSTSRDNITIPDVNSCLDASTCYSQSFSFSVGNLENKEAYDIEFLCWDRGNLSSEVIFKQFQVDLDQGEKIRILSPEEYQSSKDVLIEILTNFQSNDCYYSFGNDTVRNKFSKHNSEMLNHQSRIKLKEGRYDMKVACTDGNKTYVKTKSFTIDSSQPLKGKLLVPSNTTSLSRLNARAMNFTDPESGIVLYEYAIGTSPYGNKGWNSVVNWTQTQRESLSESNLNLTSGTIYYWSVRALNGVQLYSDVVSSTGTEVLDFNIDDYANVESLCQNGLLDEGEPDIDCGPICRISCSVGSTCELDEDCYNPELLCENNMCVYKDDVSDFDDPGLNYTEDDYVEVPVELERKEVSAEIVKKSNAWIGWMVALFLLLSLTGAGYYVYVAYYRKDSSDSAISEENFSGSLTGNNGSLNTNDPKTTDSSLGKTSSSSSNVDNTEAIRKRKEELKLALRKKLVDEQKKEKIDERKDLFSRFDKDPKQDISQKDVVKKKDAMHIKNVDSDKADAQDSDSISNAAKIAKLKLMMKNHAKHNKNFSHKLKGQDISLDTLRKLHQKIIDEKGDDPIERNKKGKGN